MLRSLRQEHEREHEHEHECGDDAHEAHQPPPPPLSSVIQRRTREKPRRAEARQDSSAFAQVSCSRSLLCSFVLLACMWSAACQRRSRSFAGAVAVLEQTPQLQLHSACTLEASGDRSNGDLTTKETIDSTRLVSACVCGASANAKEKTAKAAELVKGTKDPSLFRPRSLTGKSHRSPQSTIRYLRHLSRCARKRKSFLSPSCRRERIRTSSSSTSARVVLPLVAASMPVS